MRAIATLIVVVLVSLPSLYAGWPSLSPAWFHQSWSGVPLSVLFMSGLMAVFIVLAGVCSFAARSGRSPDQGAD